MNYWVTAATAEWRRRRVEICGETPMQRREEENGYERGFGRVDDDVLFFLAFLFCFCFFFILFFLIFCFHFGHDFFSFPTCNKIF